MSSSRTIIIAKNIGKKEILTMLSRFESKTNLYKYYSAIAEKKGVDKIELLQSKKDVMKDILSNSENREKCHAIWEKYCYKKNVPTLRVYKGDVHDEINGECIESLLQPIVFINDDLLLQINIFDNGEIYNYLCKHKHNWCFI